MKNSEAEALCLKMDPLICCYIMVKNQNPIDLDEHYHHKTAVMVKLSMSQNSKRIQHCFITLSLPRNYP